MNEFRKFLGLKQFETFEEWNPDPSVAVRYLLLVLSRKVVADVLMWWHRQNAARQLYGHINNLELYVGLQGEVRI